MVWFVVRPLLSPVAAYVHSVVEHSSLSILVSLNVIRINHKLFGSYRSFVARSITRLYTLDGDD